MATPAEPRAEKKIILCTFWAVEKFLYLGKSAGEIFLSGLRGAKSFSVAFRIVFRIFFRVFQTVFRIGLKAFRGEFRSADMPPKFSERSFPSCGGPAHQIHVLLG